MSGRPRLDSSGNTDHDAHRRPRGFRQRTAASSGAHDDNILTVKRLLSSLIDLVVGVLATRFLVVAIATAALVAFGLGLAGNAVLVADYSMDRVALRSERLIASLIVVANLAFLLSALALWRKARGMRSLYFNIPPRAWIGLAVVAQAGGFFTGRWVFSP